jgi:hypothetical protein
MLKLLFISFAILLLPAAFFTLRYKWYVGRREPAHEGLFWTLGFGYIILFVVVFHYWLHAY